MPIEEPQCPGAQAPERLRFIETPGAMLRLYEWGDPKAPAVLCAHGFLDHGRGYDLLAPILSQHYRVISLDARGHGDSSRCAAYPWRMDVRDILYVLRELGRGTHLIGHSRGGGQMTDAALFSGDRVGRLVVLDGFGPPDDGLFRRPGMPDFASMTLPERCAHFLDARRRADEKLEWSPRPRFDDLVQRRAAQNPKLDETWLRYFVYHGACESEDGWRWKSDPMLTSAGFGPFRADWIAPSWVNLEPTMLALIGGIEDQWGPLPEDVLASRLAHVPRLERATVEGSGSFHPHGRDRPKPLP